MAWSGRARHLPPNELLRQARLQLPSPSGSGRPMSRQELADAVNAHLGTTAPADSGIDANYVGKLERGHNRWPGSARREAFRHVLGVTSNADLGFYINRRIARDRPDAATWQVAHIGESHRAAHQPRPMCEADDIDRRSLLRAGIAAAAFPATALDIEDLRHLVAAVDDARRYLDDDVVALLRRRLADCAAEDGSQGPRRTLPAVLGVVGIIDAHSRQVQPAVRRRLLAVGARGAEFLGWLYRDLGHSDLADYWRDRATEWAYEAGEQAMPGYVLLKKSQSAWDHRDGLRMLTLAQAVQDGPWSLPARVRAEAAQQEARGHAMITHDLDLIERKLDEARVLLRQDAATATDRVPVAEHYDEALLGVQTAICYRQAQQPERAVALFKQWLRPGLFSPRDYAYFLTLKAETLAVVADPDSAAACGIEALPVALRTGSGRTVAELRRLRARLRPWDARPLVREFCQLLPA